ncbi:MAG: aminoacyl-tRNA hydrolase [Deltaproteobacteria bacterium]|jgi:PTH1 family peptidyl-tRNA hydrolase|nr:aminoacyl-tRNA hydrolase [Deltaproteobacteria bacterium]
MDPSGTKLVLGLGNPGPAYSDTRHNVGFMALDAYVSGRPGAAGPPSNFKSSVIAVGSKGGSRVILAWPQTYMNLSGHAARELVAFYKVSPADGLLVVHDEMDLPPGKVKASRGGGSAGHRGIDSIKEFVHADFARLRIGIGRQPKDFWGGSTGNADYVLSPFLDEELPEVEDSLKAASSLIAVWIKDGLAAAQRLGNRRPPKPKKEKEAAGDLEGGKGREDSGVRKAPGPAAGDVPGGPGGACGPGATEGRDGPGGPGGAAG